VPLVSRPGVRADNPGVRADDYPLLLLANFSEDEMGAYCRGFERANPGRSISRECT